MTGQSQWVQAWRKLHVYKLFLSWSVLVKCDTHPNLVQQRRSRCHHFHHHQMKESEKIEKASYNMPSMHATHDDSHFSILSPEKLVQWPLEVESPGWTHRFQNPPLSRCQIPEDKSPIRSRNGLGPVRQQVANHGWNGPLWGKNNVSQRTFPAPRHIVFCSQLRLRYGHHVPCGLQWFYEHHLRVPLAIASHILPLASVANFWCFAKVFLRGWLWQTSPCHCWTWQRAVFVPTNGEVGQSGLLFWNPRNGYKWPKNMPPKIHLPGPRMPTGNPIRHDGKMRSQNSPSSALESVLVTKGGNQSWHQSWHRFDLEMRGSYFSKQLLWQLLQPPGPRELGALRIETNINENKQRNLKTRIPVVSSMFWHFNHFCDIFFDRPKWQHGKPAAEASWSGSDTVKHCVLICAEGYRVGKVQLLNLTSSCNLQLSCLAA